MTMTINVNEMNATIYVPKKIVKRKDITINIKAMNCKVIIGRCQDDDER